MLVVKGILVFCVEKMSKEKEKKRHDASFRIINAGNVKLNQHYYKDSDHDGKPRFVATDEKAFVEFWKTGHSGKDGTERIEAIRGGYTMVKIGFATVVQSLWMQTPPFGQGDWQSYRENLKRNHPELKRIDEGDGREQNGDASSEVKQKNGRHPIFLTSRLSSFLVVIRPPLIPCMLVVE